MTKKHQRSKKDRATLNNFKKAIEDKQGSQEAMP